MIDQIAANAYDLGGFPCHKKNPGNDILTCPSEELNAKDCIGYQMMRENQKAEFSLHPEVVDSFDELVSF